VSTFIYSSAYAIGWYYINIIFLCYVCFPLVSWDISSDMDGDVHFNGRAKVYSDGVYKVAFFIKQAFKLKYVHGTVNDYIFMRWPHPRLIMQVQ